MQFFWLYIGWPYVLFNLMYVEAISHPLSTLGPELRSDLDSNSYLNSILIQSALSRRDLQEKFLKTVDNWCSNFLGKEKELI